MKIKDNNYREVPLKDQAYNYIKEKIIKCIIMPGGEISEQGIASEMGISRTPVREAILRLSQENFIVIYPRKGMIVSPVTLQDIHEVFQVRSMVEPYVAIHGLKNISKEILLQFKKYFEDFITVNESKPYVKYFEKDIEFHKYIISSFHNEHIISFMDKIYDLDYRIRALSTLDTEDIEERSKPEHIEIIDALLDNNEDRIKKSIMIHLDGALTAALRRIYN